MMEHDPRPESTALFTTLEQIRSEHARLLDADCGDDAPGPEFWVAVQRFATCVAESGIYFDEPHEVKACQGYLSYWERELSRARAERRLTGNLRVPELKPYDEAALRDLQTRYTNPFEGLAKEAHALVKDVTRTRSKDELVKLVEGMAAAAGLRFELDLVKEISNQVAGDTFAPTLVEFCLHHLFEEPGTRVGNKVRRPSNERSFSCLAYLVDKTEQLYTQQGPTEKRAMLDALSLYATRYEPRLPWDTIPGPEIEAVDGAASPTFKDSGGRTMPLRSFLVSSRLLFEYGPGLSIVHPGLFRRWPELLAEIRVRKDREQRRRRARLYGAIAAAVVFFAFGAWQYQARQGEEAEKIANDLAAESYTTSVEKRLPLALNALNTSHSSTTKAAVNEAVWGLLAADAKSAKDRNPPGEALADRGYAPLVEPCARTASEGRPLCFVNSKGERVMLPGPGRDDTASGIDPNETWVAVGWPKFGGQSKAAKIELAVYRIDPGGTAELVGGIRDTKCEGLVGSVRVNPTGSAVTIDCVPTSEEGPLWDLVAVSGDVSNEFAISLDKLKKEERDSIQAIYFAPPEELGAATLKDGGVLEMTTDAGKRLGVFRSDILRVMGRPSHLAFRKDRGFAALGAFNAPLVLVHEETGNALGHDAIYPVPEGLGAAKEVKYSPTGQCIEVHTVDQGKNAFAYHIILDESVLKDVAKGMGASPPRYDARTLCGFKGPAK